MKTYWEARTVRKQRWRYYTGLNRGESARKMKRRRARTVERLGKENNAHILPPSNIKFPTSPSRKLHRIVTAPSVAVAATT